MPTSPPFVTPMPSAPTVADSESTFDAKAYAFAEAWVDMVPEVNVIAQWMAGVADEAFDSASALLTQTLPALTGKELALLRVNAAGSGTEFATPFELGVAPGVATIPNAGFEMGVAGAYGKPPHWSVRGSLSNVLDFLRLYDVSDDPGPYGSKVAFGSLNNDAGPWWTTERHFKVVPGQVIDVAYGVKLGVTNPVSSSVGQDAQFIGEDDAFVEFVYRDASHAVVSVQSAPGACSQYWNEIGGQPPAMTRLDLTSIQKTVPAGAVYVSIAVVAVDNNDQIVADRRDYETYASGNASVLVDYLLADSASHALEEVSEGVALGTDAAGEAARIQSAIDNYDIISRMGAAGIGAVGTYAMLSLPDGSAVAAGSVHSGSVLSWSSVASATAWNYDTSNSVSSIVGYGSWMALGASGASAGFSHVINTIFLRIA